MGSVRDGWKSWIPYLFLLAAAFLAYVNTFGNGWTYDDFPVIVENSDVRSWAGFLKDSYPGRPLRELTYLLDYSLFGYEPAGWHIQQIFWHGLNGCLLFALGRRLGLATWAILPAALLFLLHPIQVEVVANLSHRKDSLALAGSLGAILCYLKFLKMERQGWGWAVGALICSVLALLGKQTAVALPFVLGLLEVLRIGRARRLLWRWPVWSCMVGMSLGMASVVWLWSRIHFVDLPATMRDTLAFKANYFGDFSIPLYYLTIVKSWVYMVGKLLWPTSLAVEYTFPVAGGRVDPFVWLGLAGLIGLIVLLWFWWRRWPTGSWLLASALLFFLPTSNLWPSVYLAADRYYYAPLAFLALLAGFGLQRLGRSKWCQGGAVLVLFLLFWLSWQQSQVWASPASLWQNAIRVSPTSSFALNNLGNLALQEGAVAEAQNYYQRSVEANRFNPTAHYNLGMLAEQRHDLRQALKHYRAFALLDHPVYRQQLQALREHLRRNYGISL